MNRRSNAAGLLPRAARVNLLPWREEQRRKRQQRFLLAISAAVLAGMLAVFAARFAVQDALAEQRTRNDLLRTEVERLDRQVAELERLQSRREHLLTRMRTIVELQVTRPLVVRLLDELVEILPAGVQLLEVRQDGNRIVLDGLAESSSRVAALMRNIDGSAWLQAPRLELVEAASEGVARSARFTIVMEQGSKDEGT